MCGGAKERSGEHGWECRKQKSLKWLGYCSGGRMKSTSRLAMILLAAALSAVPALRVHGGSHSSIMDLTLEELLDLKISSSTMLEVETREEPGTVLYFDRKAIAESGARTLNEFMEVHVPGVHLRNHIVSMPHMAMRGIISDRDDKYLTIVDGVIVNDRFKAGSDTERDIPLLADIDSVRVVLGPASVLHGSGAIAGLIIIETINARTADEGRLKLRAGAIEDFYSFEISRVYKFDSDSGLLVYVGVNDYRGADQKDAPLFFSHSFNSPTHGDVVAGEPVPWDIIDYNRSFQDEPKYKAQLHYYRGDFDARFRYISSGRSQDYNHLNIGLYDEGGIDYGYRQWHLSLNYDYDLGKDLTLQSFASVLGHHHRLERMFIDPLAENRSGYRYYETTARLKLLWQPPEETSDHQLAALLDVSNGEWGKKTEGRDNTPDLNDFSSQTYSVGLEHIWRARQDLNVFSNVRLDKHTSTDYNSSYRLASVYHPGDADTLKLAFARSYRNQVEQTMRLQTREGIDQEPEDASSVTLTHLHDFQTAWRSRLTYFYYDHDYVGFDNNTKVNGRLGTFEHHGVELDLRAVLPKGNVGFNHSYTKLLSADLIDPGISQSRSADPYGYGDDLAIMPNHITKLYGTYRATDKTRLNASLRMLFETRGDRDLAEYYTAQPRQVSPADPGETRFSDASYFLNLGLAYAINDGAELRLDLWNVLGWSDKKHNKRGSVKRVGTYRYEPASIGLTLDMKF